MSYFNNLRAQSSAKHGHTERLHRSFGGNSGVGGAAPGTGQGPGPGPGQPGGIGGVSTGISGQGLTDSTPASVAIGLGIAMEAMGLPAPIGIDPLGIDPNVDEGMMGPMGFGYANPNDNAANNSTNSADDSSGDDSGGDGGGGSGDGGGGGGDGGSPLRRGGRARRR